MKGYKILIQLSNLIRNFIIEMVSIQTFKFFNTHFESDFMLKLVF